jgi:hypothetical protein
MSGRRRPRVLSGDTIKAVLERQERDARGYVPPPEQLYTIDDLRDAGVLPPDEHFIIKRLEECDAGSDLAKTEEVHRRALLDLLRNCLRLGIPLSQKMLDQTAGELERLWFPDPKAEKRWRNEALAHSIEAQIDVLVAKGKSVEEARNVLARNYGHASGEALGKWLDRNRRRAGHKGA